MCVYMSWICHGYAIVNYLKKYGLLSDAEAGKDGVEEGGGRDGAGDGGEVVDGFAYVLRYEISACTRPDAFFCPGQRFYASEY